MKKELIVTSAQEQGRRDYQEDRYFFKRITGNDYMGWLLAIMDGHSGGPRVAEICVGEIGNLFVPGNSGNIENALRSLVAALNVKTSGYFEGSTLSVVCILDEPRKAIVAILGDSPVVIEDLSGKIHVSPEHNARSNMQERESAIKRGGEYRGGYLTPRHGGYGLQLSRSLGDSYLEGIISRDPEIYTIDDPVWIMVASDGIVDPGHTETHSLIQEIGEMAKRSATADDLMKWASARGLSDNATVLVCQ